MSGISSNNIFNPSSASGSSQDITSQQLQSRILAPNTNSNTFQQQSMPSVFKSANQKSAYNDLQSVWSLLRPPNLLPDSDQKALGLLTTDPNQIAGQYRNTLESTINKVRPKLPSAVDIYLK